MSETRQAREQELRLSVSDKEVLQKKDFAQMSAAEIAQVTRAIAQMKLPQAELRTRRYQPDTSGLRLHKRPTPRGFFCTRGRPARYLRLDERIYQAVSAFPACHHRCPQARLGVPVRYTSHQCD